MRTPSSSTTSKTTPCCSKEGIKRGPWTPEEDEILANFVRKEGEGRWRTLPKRAGLQRCGKSCRLRWMNYLRPSVKRGRIGDDEEDLILRLHRLLGNRWSLIAGRIPGRTDNEIKNYWNTHLSKKLIRQGIDPRTHKPLINNINPNAQKAALGSYTTSNPHPASQISTITPTPDIGSTSNQTNNTNAIQSNWKPENNHTADGHISNWNWPSYDGNVDKINGCEEDVFSSFLNSLINDNGNGNQQLDNEFVVPQSQQQQPISSSIQSFNLAFWEAELMKGSSLNTLGEEVEQHGSRKDSNKPAN